MAKVGKYFTFANLEGVSYCAHATIKKNVVFRIQACLVAARAALGQ
ncbi:MAG: hypothetical protein SNG49_02610 [Rikenellaceae bacterium]